jgi:transcriptional regulator NrdR family protein
MNQHFYFDAKKLTGRAEIEAIISERKIEDVVVENIVNGVVRAVAMTMETRLMSRYSIYCLSCTMRFTGTPPVFTAAMVSVMKIGSSFRIG